MKIIQNRKVYVYVYKSNGKKRVRKIEKAIYKKLKTISIVRGMDIIDAISNVLVEFSTNANIFVEKKQGIRIINIILN